MGDRMIGRTISHYRVLRKLGEGGMAVVYEAQDTQLDRLIALKFPRIEFDGRHADYSRFMREAKAAAALDHSSICPVYDFSETDGRPFFVMPLLEGRSLRDRISDGPLPMSEALTIAVDVAEGLKAAHAHDIVHRDIKASNIIVTDDGHAKILDFGLAQIRGATRLTRTGITVGTVDNMSPEQAGGGEVDHRTDIWSLGVVMYEMVTGELPFKSDYDPAVIYAIMNKKHAPASSVHEGIPPEMDWIIDKCLAKAPDDRYETTDELLSDLRALRAKYAGGGVPDIPSWILKNQRKLFFAALGVLAVSAVILMAQMRIFPFDRFEIPGLAAPTVPQGTTLRITAGPAWSGQPVIAPGGTRIAYVSDAAGNRDIYVIDARGGTPLQLTFDPATDQDPAWFPDGSAIVFTSTRDGKPGVWRVGQLGGGATLLLADAMEPEISADGRRIAFVRSDAAGNERIWVGDLSDLAGAKPLTSDDDGRWYHREPTWSPDGSTICYRTRHGLWAISATGSRAYPLTKDDQVDLDPVWSPDGRYIYFSSYREGTFALWRIRSKGGEAQRLTLGTGPESHPSLSRDCTRLAYTTTISRHSLALVDLADGAQSELPGLRDDWMPTLAPDGRRVVFVSDRWGANHNLWVQDLAGIVPSGTARRLTAGPGDAAFPAFSPDGRWIAYYRILDGARDIMTLSLGEGLTFQITEHPADDVQPTWAPDGAALAFASGRSGNWQIWTVPIENGRRRGEPRRLTAGDASAIGPAWSHDGDLIAYIEYQGNQSDVFVIGLQEGDSARRITTDADAAAVAWDGATGDLLVAAAFGEKDAELRRFSRTGGEIGPTRIPIAFGEKSGYTRFAVSADGRVIVYSRQQLTGDVWLLESREQPY